MKKDQKNKQKYSKTLQALIVFFSLAPITSFAALNGVKGLLTDFGKILNSIIPIVIGLALIYFFWGVSQFILGAGEPAKREEGRQRMIWGVVALFVMFSIMGILTWIGDTIGISIPGTTTTGEDIQNFNPYQNSGTGNG